MLPNKSLEPTRSGCRLQAIISFSASRSQYLARGLIEITVASIAFSAGANQFQCKYDGTQQEMNSCAVKDYQDADHLLNKTYKNVMSSLTESKQNALRTEQRAWLKTRDAKCHEEAKESEGGSIWPLEYYGCLEKLTKHRTKELQAWKPK